MMPPRTAKSPGSTTVPVRENPFSARKAMQLVAVDAVARCSGEGLRLRSAPRGTTRCRTAFTVVSSTVGLRQRLEQPRQRREPARHDVGDRRDAVIGQAIPGGKAKHLELGAKKASWSASTAARWSSTATCTMTRVPDRLRDLRQEHGIEALRHAGDVRCGRTASAAASGWKGRSWRDTPSMRAQQRPRHAPEVLAPACVAQASRSWSGNVHDALRARRARPA